jgi:hypothetical protein
MYVRERGRERKRWGEREKALKWVSKAKRSQAVRVVDFCAFFHFYLFL